MACSNSIRQLCCTSLALIAVAAPAQTVTVPRSGPVTAQPGTQQEPGLRVFTPQQLKDRPYNGGLPKPAFPSTERVQRAFTIAFVYDYAYSSYTPSVTLPIQPKLAAKRDTPEAALIAFTSAMRSGDFDAFVQCWDKADRATFNEMRKQPSAVAGMLAGWKQAYSGAVQLLDRIETTGYVILDTRTVGNQLQIPNVLKLEDGEWRLTNDLGRAGNPFVGNFPTDVAGNITHVQPAPEDTLEGAGGRDLRNAQAEFLKQHAYRSTSVEAAK